MYAVIKNSGRQFKVSPGDLIDIDELGIEEGQPVELPEVLLVADGASVSVGSPTVEGATVRATSVGPVRGPKIRIFKYRAKKRYRKRQGHRQHYTRVRIDEIVTAAS